MNRCPMPTHYNSASRLLMHFEAILACSNGVSAAEAWSIVFSINEPDGHQQVFKISERLCALNEEIRRMETAIVAAGSIGPDLYATPFQVARRAISPALLNGTIDQIKAFIASEVRTPFRYMVPSIPTDESTFAEEDLIELNKLIARLQEIVDSSALAQPLLNIVRSHIALLLRGLALYPIHGPQALRDALKHMAVDLFENKDVVQEFQDSSEIGLLGTIWKKAQSMTTKVSAASDYITVGTLAYEASKVIIPGVSG
jgi:hypothetical protein